MLTRRTRLLTVLAVVSLLPIVALIQTYRHLAHRSSTSLSLADSSLSLFHTTPPPAEAAQPPQTNTMSAREAVEQKIAQGKRTVVFSKVCRPAITSSVCSRRQGHKGGGGWLQLEEMRRKALGEAVKGLRELRGKGRGGSVGLRAGGHREEAMAEQLSRGAATPCHAQRTGVLEAAVLACLVLLVSCRSSLLLLP